MQKRNLLKLLPILIFGMIFWTSCDSNRIYEEYANIEAEGWNVDFSPQFEVNLEDTSSAYNLIVHIRNHKDYAYRNVWIRIQTEYPDGTFSSDSMNLFLSDESGRELGKCSNGTCENAFLVNKKGPIKFPYSGKYIFKIEHLMRTDTQILPHIGNVGLRVEKAVPTAN